MQSASDYYISTETALNWKHEIQTGPTEYTLNLLAVGTGAHFETSLSDTASMAGSTGDGGLATCYWNSYKYIISKFPVRGHDTVVFKTQLGQKCSFFFF